MRVRERIANLIPLVFLMCLASILNGSLISQGENNFSYFKWGGEKFSIVFNSKAEVVEARIGQEVIPTSKVTPILLRELTDVFSSPNILPNNNFSKGLNHWYKKELAVYGFPVLVVNGGLDVLFQDLSQNYLGILFSETFDLPPYRQYVVSVLLSSDFGFMEEGLTPLLRIGLQWLDGDGEVIGEETTLVPEGVTSCTARFTNITRSPDEAVRARLTLLFEWRRKYKSCNLNNFKFHIEEIYFAPLPEEACWKPITGTLKKEGQCFVFEHEDESVRIVVYFENRDPLRVSGVIENLENRERAVEIAFSLPLKLEGWSWWDNPYEARVISEGNYFNVVNSLSVQGYLPISLYPVSYVSKDSMGLGYFVDLLNPKIFVLGYEEEIGLYAYFSIGLAGTSHKKSSFSVEVKGYSDSAWGFRQALEDYYNEHPEWFVSELNLVGRRVEWSGGKYGCMFQQASLQYLSAAKEMTYYDGKNVYIAQYVLPWEAGPPTYRDVKDPAPSYGEMIRILNENLQEEEKQFKMAEAFNTHAEVDCGAWVFSKYIKGPNYRPEEWVVKIPLNTDPDIRGGMWDYTLEVLSSAKENCGKTGVTMDGVELDNFMARSRCLTLTVPQKESEDNGLTYDPNTFRPALHFSFTAVEYLEELRKYLERESSDLGLTGNFISKGASIFGAIYLDAIPFEANPFRKFNWGKEELIYRRFVGGKKPLWISLTERKIEVKNPLHRELIQEYVDESLFYGMMPGFYAPFYEDKQFTQTFGQLLQRAFSIYKELFRANWEPVTLAKLKDRELLMERFGLPPGNIYFTVHNTGEERKVAEIEIDNSDLGITSLEEIWKNRSINFQISGDKISVKVEINPNETLIIKGEAKEGRVKPAGTVTQQPPKRPRLGKESETGLMKQILMVTLPVALAVLAVVFYVIVKAKHGKQT